MKRKNRSENAQRKRVHSTVSIESDNNTDITQSSFDNITPLYYNEKIENNFETIESNLMSMNIDDIVLDSGMGLDFHGDLDCLKSNNEITGRDDIVVKECYGIRHCSNQEELNFMNIGFNIENFIDL